MDDKEVDIELSQAFIEYTRAIIKEKHVYGSASNFNEKMLKKKSKYTEKEITIWDRALIVIRNYNKRHYLEYIGEIEDDNAWFKE